MSKQYGMLKQMIACRLCALIVSGGFFTIINGEIEAK